MGKLQLLKVKLLVYNYCMGSSLFWGSNVGVCVFQTHFKLKQIIVIRCVWVT